MADEPRGTAVSPLPVTAGPGALKEVASLFLRLGSTAFGGPAAHIAMMEDGVRSDLVDRWHWLSEAQLLDAPGFR